MLYTPSCVPAAQLLVMARHVQYLRSLVRFVAYRMGSELVFHLVLEKVYCL
jgi:hypothetical protein